MRAICDLGISGGIRSIGASTWSCRTCGGLGKVRRTRGCRTDWSARVKGGKERSLTGCFGANSASASWRAFVIRSRSSPRVCGCCRLNKAAPSGRSICDIEREFVTHGKLEIGQLRAGRRARLMRRVHAAAIQCRCLDFMENHCEVSLLFLVASHAARPGEPLA
jgi:hypothetical protein